MKGKLAILTALFLLFSCNANRANANNIASKGKNMMASDITTETKIRDIISNPSLGDWGRLLFPASEVYWSGDTLGDLQLTWYSHINPQKTVEIVRYVAECAENGEQVFFDIYSEEEKQAWQRSGRGYSAGMSKIPYLYVAEIGGFELDTNTRERKAARLPNATVPFSYLTYSHENSPMLPIYEKISAFMTNIS